MTWDRTFERNLRSPERRSRSSSSSQQVQNNMVVEQCHSPAVKQKARSVPEWTRQASAEWWQPGGFATSDDPPQGTPVHVVDGRDLDRLYRADYNVSKFFAASHLSSQFFPTGAAEVAPRMVPTRLWPYPNSCGDRKAFKGPCVQRQEPRQHSLL